MSYAILRTKKITSKGGLMASAKHNFRERETPNADPELTPNNTHEGALNAQQLNENFEGRVSDIKIRKNAVLAVEYLVTHSPDAKPGDGYFEDAKKWLEAKHGAENIIGISIHRDETTPHMVAYVVPIDERGKLNCSRFLDGRKALSDMQSDFADRVGRKHGLERGIEGSKAQHTEIKKYYEVLKQAQEPLPPTELEQKIEAIPMRNRYNYEIDKVVKAHEESLKPVNPPVLIVPNSKDFVMGKGKEIAEKNQALMNRVIAAYNEKKALVNTLTPENRSLTIRTHELEARTKTLNQKLKEVEEQAKKYYADLKTIFSMERQARIDMFDKNAARNKAEKEKALELQKAKDLELERAKARTAEKGIDR